jgi:hypothetical protein
MAAAILAQVPGRDDNQERVFARTAAKARREVASR